MLININAFIHNEANGDNNNDIVVDKSKGPISKLVSARTKNFSDKLTLYLRLALFT